jgi:integrase
MSDVFKPTYHRKIPESAKTVTRDGKTFAKIRLRNGQILEGEVLGEGKKCRLQTTEYYARIKQPDGRTVRVPLEVTDKEAAQQLRAKLQKEADQQRAGLIDRFAKHLLQPLIGCPKPLPKRVHLRDRWGRITKFRSELAIGDLQAAIQGSHLEDYSVHLFSSGRSAAHRWETVRTIRRICIDCKFRQIQDLNAGALDQYLANMINSGRTFRTRNASLKAMRAFNSWMTKSERIPRDPFAMLSVVNEASDPNRRLRRPLTPEEFFQLLEAAERGSEIEAITGIERAILYLVAAWTGLRRKELAAILRMHLNLENDPAVVHLPGVFTKAKRDDQPIPLHPVVAERLNIWLKSRNLKPSEPVFNLRTRGGKLRKTSKMMQLDCAAAGLPYVGDFGVADFHSHRVAFITNLCRTADFSVAVDLARHSDPKLTAKIYDRVRLEDRVAAINGLAPPRLTEIVSAGNHSQE